MSEAGPNRNFEAKVASLIAATRHLELPQILMLRRLTLRDPETRKWASDKQLSVVFTVILTKAAERMGLDQLKLARDKNFAPLLPTETEARREDLKVLSDLAMQMLGPPQLSEAETTQAGFEALLARGAQTVTPPRTNRGRQAGAAKEPPPLFAAQIAPKGEKSMSPAKAVVQQVVGGSGGGKPVDFTVLFDDTICAYSRKIISLFRVAGSTKGMRVPFLVAPEFSDVYEEVLRRHLLPQMRSTRHVSSLAMSYNWSEVGGDKLIDIIQGSEVNNPVLHNWDGRWNAFRAPKPVKKKPAALKPEDNPWPLFREEATRCNYEPPKEEHLQVLQDIIRQEADVIAKAWRELSQLYQQEFVPNGRQEQAREGALRDGIMKWSQKLPDHIGEHLAIKAHFEFERCDGHFMRRLVGNFGRNDSERRRNAPFLSDFVLLLPG